MRRILPVAIAAFAAVTTAITLGATGTGADTADASANYQTWYFRAEPVAPVLPAPQGPLQPVTNEQITTPNQIVGGYVVSSAGGEPGGNEGQGDLAWSAFQWDLLPAQGGAIDEFVLTLAQAPDGRGDAGPPVIQACNIATVWAASPTSNAWAARPASDCSVAVPPTEGTANGRKTFTFDLTSLAKGWLDGTGFGVMIVPGNPTVAPPLTPFQLTFAGYDHPEVTARPQVTFRYTPAAGSSLDGGGFGDLSIGADLATGELVPVPGLDAIPTDVGSGPLTPAAPAGGSGGGTAPAPSVRTRPVASSGGGFPGAGWLLVPLALIAFWGTGTALGPAGDPILAREGGVSRVLAARRAAEL